MKTSTLILIIIIIIIAFGLGWYISTQRQAQPTEPVVEEEVVEGTRPGWIKYDSSELGISFQYPQEYGQVILDIKPGETGFQYRGKFSASNVIEFGGVSDNFSEGREVEDVDVKSAQDKPYWMYNPREEIVSGANVTGKLFTQVQKHPDMFYSQGTMLAIFGLRSSANFNAIAFLTSSLSPEEFKDLLSTLSVQ